MTVINQTKLGILPERDTYTCVSGANSDINSDQHRAFSLRRVIGYSEGHEFICLQTGNCWPTVERLSNCFFRTDDVREGRTDDATCFSGYQAMIDAGFKPVYTPAGWPVRTDA